MELPDFTPSKIYPPAIILDVDGCAAEIGNRSPYDEAKVYSDTPRIFIIETVKAILKNNPDMRLFVFSGRTDGCRPDTVKWFHYKCGFNILPEIVGGDVVLAMRKTGDRRRDSEVKRDLYNEFVKGKYNVFAVFDDRAQVIRELWAAENLPVFRCGVIDKDDF